MESMIEEIGREFDVFGEFIDASSFGTGHINDTYQARYDQGGREIHYVHQRINHEIFRNPHAQMENIQRVTRHVREKLKARNTPDRTRRSLRVVPTVDGKPYLQDRNGNFWRTYVMIENSYSVNVVTHPEMARETGRAFGEFQALVSDIPAPRLHETIPKFHHTPSRVQALIDAVSIDSHNRVQLARQEITFAMERKSIASTLVDLLDTGDLPERVVHNDTKINNLLLDQVTRKPICVVDLDTVMPGLVQYDFGDLVRTVTSPADEDEKDLNLVAMRMPYFQALTEGYLEAAIGFLTAEEIETLAFGGKLITYEIGIRFLTDFLEGDRYFKTLRDEQNLDRCRTQFKLIESIEKQENEMQQFVLETANRLRLPA